MEFISTKEASAKWGISPTRISILAKEGRIPGAQRVGRSWLIPASATKPPERKANHSRTVRKETEQNDFFFPLFHFRPDWNDAKEAQLSEQQRSLLLAENAVLECRFADAWPVLEGILSAPDDIYIEIGCLWHAGMCCIALNQLEDFYRIFLRLQMLLSQDFPHRDDLVIILDGLKTYVETMEFAARNTAFSTNIHHQALPMMCILKGYMLLARETMMPGSADTFFMELSLHFLEATSAAVAMEMMHCYLLVIYSLRQNMAEAEKHAKAIVQIAYDNKIYFPLVSYYRYNVPIFSPILAQYPEDFQKLCLDLSSQYEKNYNSFTSSISEKSVFSKITEAELPYVFAVMMGLSNTRIAEKLGVSWPTVNRRLEKLCEKLGIKDKKELKAYLQNYM